MGYIYLELELYCQSVNNRIGMRGSILYIIGIACNILLLAYSVFLFVGIGSEWFDKEIYVTSTTARTTIFVMMAGTMALYLVNLSICRNNGRGLKSLFSYNLFINPVVSILFLQGKEIPDFKNKEWKRRMYVVGMYFNYGFILWLIALLTISIISNDLGNLMFSQTWIWILLGLPTIILYQVNMGICIKEDTFPRMLALIFGLVFYSPLYSRRILKNNWL